MPMRDAIDRHVCGQIRRLPTMESSFVALDTLTGRDTDIDISESFGNPYESEQMAKVDTMAVNERFILRL